MSKAFSKKNVWDAMPHGVQYLLGGILSFIPIRVYLGKKYKREISLIKKFDYASRDEINKYQLQQLKNIIQHAYNNTSFYRQYYDSHGVKPEDLVTLDDIHKFPIIDKEIVNKYRQEMVDRSAKSADMDYVTTGGTGGVPLGFYINGDRSHKEYAYLVSSWNMAGFKLGDTKCVLRGKKINAKSHGMYYTYDPLFREHYYSNFHTSEEDLTKYVEHIKQVGDCHIHAYPSSIYMLTRFMKSHDIPAPANVKSIILESENIYEDQREFVEQFFGCRCYSMYGHSEKLIAGAECAKCTDYHIWPTYGYMELLDEKERPVGEIGNRGEIIGTGFINTVQPFIRYRTGDYAEFAGNTCQICGKNHTVIRDIRGHRIQEYLVASDGSLVPWAAVNMHDNTFDNIRQYQFFQEKQGEILIRVVVSNNYREDDGKRIISNINQKLGEKFKIDLQIVNTIKLTNRGKSVFVVQKILSDL